MAWNTMSDRDPAIPMIPRPLPDVRDFALLAGLDAAVRGTLISSMPLSVYAAMGSAEMTSKVYLLAGIVALICGLLVPALTKVLPRRWTYTLGCLLYMSGMALAVQGSPVAIGMALAMNAVATVTIFVCFNAYVLDYIERADLSRSQSTQMVYAATPWAVGPVAGVWMHDFWEPLPFVVAGIFACCLLAVFWWLRLGNGKTITRAKRPALNPLGYLGPFFRQPRLVAGWMFAVMRSCGWWVYVVYLPIFCIEAGLGNKVGGVALSMTNALLFAAPFVSRIARRASVRRTVRVAFAGGAALFGVATVLSPLPWLSVGAIMCASGFLITLDVVGGLPFMMAVKPSQRTEMAAVYASFRDVSGIVTPGMAYLVLLVAPLPGIFAAAGAGFAIMYLIAGRLHPRLGVERPSRGRDLRA
jgi:MFS transporter, ACDE family, multidrug resistance protein